MDQWWEKDHPGGDGGSATAHDRIVDEFRLLLDALAHRAEEYLTSRSEAADGRGEFSASCGWCPLCTVVALLRGQRIDLRLVEQVAAAIILLRQSLAEPYERQASPDQADMTPDADPADTDPADTDPETAPETDPAPETKVQRISVRRVSGRVLPETTTAGEGRQEC